MHTSRLFLSLPKFKNSPRIISRKISCRCSTNFMAVTKFQRFIKLDKSKGRMTFLLSRTTCGTKAKFPSCINGTYTERIGVAPCVGCSRVYRTRRDEQKGRYVRAGCRVSEGNEDESGVISRDETERTVRARETRTIK
ncbi:hypothetical protein PUN28_010238 [Cardiocondyla obscurior]|uniref:Uncharacterized protein n=1 Tax=Cardiocondyla obscurior TaxID=286306 RepID=A0AAW2FSV9_9HYME